MNILLENPLPILAVGGVLATLCGLIFLSRRNLPSLFVFAVVVMLTVLLFITEQLIVTQGEEVEVAVDTLLAAVATNDVPSVLELIDPKSPVHGEAQTLMPLVRVEETDSTSVVVKVDSKSSPPTAVSRFKGRLQGVHSSSEFKVFYFGKVELNWVRRDERWLLEDFVVYKDDKPLNAVESLRKRRPAAVGG